MYPSEYEDIQIIRARGKGIIPSIAKVLKQFSKEFFVLHDTDSELTINGNKNPAWGMNNTIAKLADNDSKVNLVACKTCFESALFGEEVREEKPYNALTRIQNDPEAKKKVKSLLDYLIGINGAALPDNCIHWKNIDQLSK
ncbi:TPA: hypothetical protein L4F62_006363 [Pseudomonas aeruginosa]|nr:hypothetical protein [Pseudomonas aeruginosa]